MDRADGTSEEDLVAFIRDRALPELAADPDVRVLMVTGAGRGFCAGADLKAVAAGDSANRLSAEGDGPMGPSRMLLSKPVIGAIAGHAVAGGMELALWCDLRVAAEDAVLGIPAARLGIAYDALNVGRLVSLVGPSRAKDILITARRIELASRSECRTALVPVAADSLWPAVSSVATGLALGGGFGSGWAVRPLSTARRMAMAAP